MLFTSKPDITPLNMNLDFLPEQTGSRSYEAITDEGHHLELRFSGGWLTVWLQKSGEETVETIIKEKFISPLGYTDLHPKQICYILGLTLKGKKVPHPSQEEMRDFHCFNYGNNKLHWKQEFLADPYNDIDELISIIKKTFPDAIFLQKDYDWKKGTSRIKQLHCKKNSAVDIGIGCHSFTPSLLNKEYVDYPYETTIFPLYISMHKDCANGKQNPNGIGYLEQRLEHYPEYRKQLNINWNRPSSYNISTAIDKDDQYARSCLEKLLTLCHDYFHNNFEAYDLLSKKKITPQHQYRLKWVSRNYYKWIQSTEDRYSHFTVEHYKEPLFIGFKPTDQKTIPTEIILSAD